MSWRGEAYICMANWRTKEGKGIFTLKIMTLIPINHEGLI